MKAIELLDIVQSQCTEQNSYQVLRYGKHRADETREDMREFLKEYCLGESGRIISTWFDEWMKHENFVIVWPEETDDGFYHDFDPINAELPVFSGWDCCNQFVCVYPLE